MERLGDINFYLEDLMTELVNNYNYSYNQIFRELFYELNKFPELREEYEDGSSPEFYYNSKKIIKKPSSKFKKLIKKYKKHDLQWGEIIFIVYGYLHIHFENVKQVRYK